MNVRMDPWLLWLRAGFVGLFFFGFGVVGHASADGLLPGRTALAFLLGACVIGSAPLLRAPASTLRLTAMLVAGQMVVHGVLTVTSGHRGDAPMAASRAAMSARPVTPSRDGSLYDIYQQSVAQHSGGGGGPVLPIGHLVNDLSAHATMMAAHLAAAALVGLWLAWGERCLWSLIALAAHQVAAVAHVVLLPPMVRLPKLSSPVDVTPVMAVSLWQSRPRSRRGPPVVTG